MKMDKALDLYLTSHPNVELVLVDFLGLAVEVVCAFWVSWMRDFSWLSKLPQTVCQT